MIAQGERSEALGKVADTQLFRHSPPVEANDEKANQRAII